MSNFIKEIIKGAAMFFVFGISAIAIISLIDNKHKSPYHDKRKKTDRPNNPSFLIELIDIILILLSPHP